MAEEVKNESVSVKSEAKAMLEKIRNTGKIAIRIPLGKDEKEGAFVSVGINGVFFQVQKGVSVEVPKAVAEVLANSKYI